MTARSKAATTKDGNVSDDGYQINDGKARELRSLPEQGRGSSSSGSFW